MIWRAARVAPTGQLQRLRIERPVSHRTAPRGCDQIRSRTSY